jgi:hypothetical protein
MEGRPGERGGPFFCLAQKRPARHYDAMRTLALLALIALSGCGSPNGKTVGGVTRSEAQALNDAATMLDKNAVAPMVRNESISKP